MEAGQVLCALVDPPAAGSGAEPGRSEPAARYGTGGQRQGNRTTNGKTFVERGVGTREQRDTAGTTAAALDAVVGATARLSKTPRSNCNTRPYARRSPSQRRRACGSVNAGNLVRANDPTAARRYQSGENRLMCRSGFQKRPASGSATVYGAARPQSTGNAAQ